MFDSSKYDQEADVVVVPVIAVPVINQNAPTVAASTPSTPLTSSAPPLHEHEEQQGSPNRGCCTITMDILIPCITALMSLFFLTYTVLLYRKYDHVSVDEPASIMIAASLCRIVAAILSIVLRCQYGGGVWNILFGCLGILVGVLWMISASLQLSSFESNGFDWPIVWIVACLCNLSIIGHGIHLQRTQNKGQERSHPNENDNRNHQQGSRSSNEDQNGCMDVLLYTAGVFAILANVFFILGCIYFTYLAYDATHGNEGVDDFWLDDDDDQDGNDDMVDDPWTSDDNQWNTSDDDFWGMRTLEVSLSDYSSKDFKRASGLLVGGSLLYLVHSIVYFTAVVSRCRSGWC